MAHLLFKLGLGCMKTAILSSEDICLSNQIITPVSFLQASVWRQENLSGCEASERSFRNFHAVLNL